jgi:hypothetical protein
MNDGKAADIMVGEKIFQYYFSLGTTVRVASIVQCYLYQVIEMAGDLHGVTFFNGTQDLIHSNVKRTECEERGKN